MVLQQQSIHTAIQQYIPKHIHNQIKRFPTPVLRIRADTETDKRMKTQASQQDLQHLVCNAS